MATSSSLRNSDPTTFAFVYHVRTSAPLAKYVRITKDNQATGLNCPLNPLQFDFFPNQVCLPTELMSNAEVLLGQDQ